MLTIMTKTGATNSLATGCKNHIKDFLKSTYSFQRRAIRIYLDFTWNSIETFKRITCARRKLNLTLSLSWGYLSLKFPWVLPSSLFPCNNIKTKFCFCLGLQEKEKKQLTLRSMLLTATELIERSIQNWNFISLIQF